jgi:hypothetical protein
LSGLDRVATSTSRKAAVRARQAIRSGVFENFSVSATDLGVTVPPGAARLALAFTRAMAIDVVPWPTPEATAMQGSREQMLDAYRDVRDKVTTRIKELLGRGPVGRV